MAKKPVVPAARMALHQFKEEIARELGLNNMDMNLSGYTTSREAGKIGGKLGGEMTKRLIETASLGMVYNEDSVPSDLD